jgi:hypothetical protein
MKKAKLFAAKADFLWDGDKGDPRLGFIKGSQWGSLLAGFKTCSVMFWFFTCLPDARG